MRPDRHLLPTYLQKSFLAVTLLSFVIATTAVAGPLFVDGNKARLRSGPGTNYKILWEAEKYTPFENLAAYKDWYAVRDYEGDVAWVHKSVIGQGQAVIVTAQKANVRKGPSTDYDIVFSVEKGYPFKVTKKEGKWYKVVDIQGDTGWIIADLVWVSR